MKEEYASVLQQLGLEGGASPGVCDGALWSADGPARQSHSPIDGSLLGTVSDATPAEHDHVVDTMTDVFRAWRMVPAPRRGEVVRLWGERLRAVKEPLGRLVSIEMGKSLQEGLGEVQEMIDICDFAVGLSRQLYGKTMHSERPAHRMYEQWHPLGVCGVITAFNFPVAVYAWNAAIALVCGDTVVWKPSEKTPLCAVAVQKTLMDAFEQAGHACAAALVCGGRDEGERIAEDARIALVSATGSCRMGRAVGTTVAKRLGRSILELGGNNAILVMPSADLDLAVRAVLFGAAGTAGQRCTSTRRVLVHQGIANEFKERLVSAYGQLTVGDPLADKHVGPLIDEDAAAQFEAAVDAAKEQGARLLVGGNRLPELGPSYVEPTVFACPEEFPLAQEETFAPILWLFETASLEAAIARQNQVTQGLASALFTRDLQEMETFLSHAGSDCGIANVNIGTSGAEIGGAFGGEKDTGGGREAGSDAWKQYMRRQTCTINYGSELPLAQGIKFTV